MPDKPIIVINDYNPRIPNPTKELIEKGTKTQPWEELEDNRYRGRVIVKAKVKKLNGWTKVGKWEWEVSWNNFKLGNCVDHDETWPPETMENRKLGGRFWGLSECWMVFKVSSKFRKGNNEKYFDVTSRWTYNEGLRPVEEKEEELPVPGEPLEQKILHLIDTINQFYNPGYLLNMVKDIKKAADEVLEAYNLGES